MAPAYADESALIEKINSVIARINAKTNELQNSINDKIGWLPGFIADKVIAGWNRFTGFLKECWDATAEIFGNLGSPSTLSATADSWSNNVGGPVSAQVQSAKSGSLSVDDNWDGTAAERYRQNLPLQEAALDKMRATFSDGISTALSDVAKGIYAFWGLLITALAALVGGIISALASSATIVGLPAAPFIAAAAALVAVGAFASGGLILKSVSAGANSTLRQKLNDNSGFRNGGWPQATTA